MAKSKRMMETDEKTGIKRQFFPITHASAILGLEKIISGKANVLSVNGKTGVVVLTKADLGLENAITDLPYATEEFDGIITAEMYQKILNSGAGDYVLQVATDEFLGGIKVGDLLAIDETGKLSAVKQFNYTAGENINISEDGEISSTGGSGSYQLPTASDLTKGGVRIGEGLTMTDDVLSADKQLNYTAGANISISNTGIISATGGGESGGVSQEYVDQKATETYQSAQAYTDSKIPTFTFEKIGEI